MECEQVELARVRDSRSPSSNDARERVIRSPNRLDRRLVLVGSAGGYARRVDAATSSAGRSLDYVTWRRGEADEAVGSSRGSEQDQPPPPLPAARDRRITSPSIPGIIMSRTTMSGARRGELERSKRRRRRGLVPAAEVRPTISTIVGSSSTTSTRLAKVKDTMIPLRAQFEDMVLDLQVDEL